MMKKILLSLLILKKMVIVFYEKEQIKQIELILFLKDIGFSLKQIKILIQDQHGKQSLELLLKQQYQENKQKINILKN